MTHIHYRAAVAADQPAINAIIREAGINPLGLQWEHFLLAVDETTGEIVGTGQIKTHGDGSHELASIATRPAHQGRGIAAELIRRLMTQHRAESSEPLYLTCRSSMRAFYERFGFRVIDQDQLPRYFKRLARVAGWFALFTQRKLLVMVSDTAA
jgi:N-acetylglutamate synthase-like GNAT family acetyltransferase